MDLDSCQGRRSSHKEVSASEPSISAKCQCNVVIRDKVFAKETYDWLHNTAPGGFKKSILKLLSVMQPVDIYTLAICCIIFVYLFSMAVITVNVEE